MSKLSDKTMHDLWVTHGVSFDAIRAIEAAVLEELAKQKPAYTFHLDSTGAAYLRGECVSKEGDPLYAAPVVQEKQEPVAWMHWYKYYDGTDVVKVAIGHAPTFNDRSPFRSEPLYAAPVVQDNPESAMSRYLRYMEGVKEPDPVERLRFFCSIAMNGRDWIDSEQFFADLAPVVPPDKVMLPREPTEAMLDAAMNRYHHISPEAKARYTQMHRENFRWDYKAMIAAAEGK